MNSRGAWILVGLGAMVALATWPHLALAQFRQSRAGFPGVPQLRPGAIEVGIAGALTSIEGSTAATVALRTGTFRPVRQGLGGGEIDVSYTRLGDLDVIDLEGALSWTRPYGRTACYPWVAVAGGVRQEWLGSFRQVRYPVGFNLGLRQLASDNAAFRIEYRFRRVLEDPVAEYTEHQARVGLSLLLRNRPAPPRKLNYP